MQTEIQFLIPHLLVMTRHRQHTPSTHHRYKPKPRLAVGASRNKEIRRRRRKAGSVRERQYNISQRDVKFLIPASRIRRAMHNSMESSGRRTRQTGDEVLECMRVIVESILHALFQQSQSSLGLSSVSTLTPSILLQTFQHWKLSRLHLFHAPDNIGLPGVDEDESDVVLSTSGVADE